MPIDPSPSNHRLWDGCLPILAFFIAATSLSILLQILTARERWNEEGHADAGDRRRASSLHIRRRVQHAATGLLFVGLSYTGIPLRAGSAMLFVGAGLLYALHRARLRSDRVRVLYLRLFGSLLRPREVAGDPPGALYFLLGTAVVALFLPARSARCAVLCLSLADPAAAVAGTILGGPTLGDDRTTVAGSAACLMVSTAVALLMGFSPVTAIGTAMASTLAEAVAPKVKMDDNFLVPVGAGIALWALEGAVV